MADRRDGRRSVGELLRDLGEGSAALVRHEMRLARLEVIVLLRKVGSGTVLVAAGGVLALLGALSFVVGLILLFGDQWLRDRYWLGALVAFVISAGLAAWFTTRAATLLSPRRLAPDQTVATLKEDKEWLKRQLTSGATSS